MTSLYQTRVLGGTVYFCFVKKQNRRPFREISFVSHPCFFAKQTKRNKLICLLYGLLPLYDPLLLYGPLPFYGPLRPSTIPMALCPFYGPLTPLQYSVSCTSLFPSVPSKALCLLCRPLPLYGSRLSTALCPSTALCTLYRPLPPLRPSVPSTRHVFLSLFREMMMFFRCFAKHVSPKQAISRNSKTSETTPLV